MQSKQIKYLDIGVSGGQAGARYGASLMIGGGREDFEYLLPLFIDLSAPGGFGNFEGEGAGHFVKMVHNGIEYGMMQSIAEGFNLMKQSQYNLNLAEVARVYNNASIVESRLMGWLISGFHEYGVNLEKISGEISHSGEGQWTVETAKEMKLNVPIIEASLQFRKDSQGNPSYTGQIVSVLRNQFGGHKVEDKK